MTIEVLNNQIEKNKGALSDTVFRRLWIGSVAINLSLWIQSVTAAWLMVSYNASPLMVALIQTASALPSFLFALPSGVMADLMERRRYLLIILGIMTCFAIALPLCAVLGILGPWLLLFFTFASGAVFALQGPAWFSAQNDVVPRAMLPSAMALTAVSYNVARAIGPALAGAAISGFGVIWVFGLNVILVGIGVGVLLLWKSQRRVNHLPAENLASGIASAVRYARHSAVMRRQIWRTILFVCVASSLWSLMPLIAAQQLTSGANGYGFLLGSIGAGAVSGALLQPYLKKRFEMNLMMAVCCVFYGVVCIVTSLTSNLPLLCVTMFCGGIAWIGVGNTNMLALQSAMPPWIRARSLAIYMMVFQGAMALGSALWGVVANQTGVSGALAISGVLMLLVMLAMNRMPARPGEDSEATEAVMPEVQSVLIDEYTLVVPDNTAVAIEITYHVRSALRDEFLRQLHLIGSVRQRDGASYWRAYRHLERVDCYVERFIVSSWAQYLRQRSRATLADQEAEHRLRTMHEGAVPPQVSHFVAEPLPR